MSSTTHEPGSLNTPTSRRRRSRAGSTPGCRSSASSRISWRCPTPRNINYLWAFGAILFYFLVVQLYSGVILAMHYAPNSAIAFDSIEKLMRDTSYGWLMRYTHMVGASLFFLAVYIHLFRGLYYGSYKSPREVLWMIGVAILLCMMATAFMGYSLVWGQMSFWAVTVITNLFSSFNSIYPGSWHRHRAVGLGRVLGGQSDAEPPLQPALHGALRAGGARRAARLGLARAGQQQPHRHRGAQHEEGNAALPSVLHHEGHVCHRGDRDRCSPTSCSGCRTTWATW